MLETSPYCIIIEINPGHTHLDLYLVTGLPVRPSHKMSVRWSVSKSGLPGEGRHEGLVPRNDVLTNGFI